MNEQGDLLKELKLQNKKLSRENRRLQTECDILKDLNEQVSKTQQFFRRETQRQLCYNQQLLRTSPYISVMVNEKLETVMASDVFFHMSDVSRDAVREGMKLSEAFAHILQEDELRTFLERCEGVLNRQGADTYLLATRKQGTEQIYQVDICYYQAENEDAKGLSIILSDMTEIVEAKEKAENADKAKSSFLAHMSHEIRTPINTVLGMNEMILRQAKDPSILEYASNIQTAGRTLLSLINSILDFSKIEEGKMEIIPVAYETASVMNNLVVSIAERAKKKGLELQVDLDPQLPVRMFGDDVRVSQVIMNLLTNAVKYTEKGSVRFRVHCGERHNGEIVLQVSVEDTGIGIRDEDLPKLFESFERLDEVRNHNIEGTGLGMSIVTRLLDMMGSHLKVQSVYGQGSIFSFDIIQKIEDETPIGDYSWRLDASRSSVGGETLRAEGSRVLVVDDNDMNLKVAENLLKLFSIAPELVESGYEAIERLRSGEHYHIIFLDHMMPGMDGIETLRRIKEENLLSEDTPVIALTANAINGAKEQYLAAGFDDYLSKPIDVMKLQNLLIRFLPKAICSFYEAGEDVAAEADAVSKLAAAGFDTESGLRYAAGDRDFYIEIVESFAADCDRNLPRIRSDWERQNLADYQIRVHALKSTARLIGANALSEMALKQELAAKARDFAAVKAGVGALLEAYRDIALRLRQALGTTQADAEPVQTGAISAEALQTVLSDATNCVDNYEFERAVALLRPLTGMHCGGITLKAPVGDIMAALDDFDAEGAREKLRALMEHKGL